MDVEDLSDRALAEKANVAQEMCDNWSKDVEALEEEGPGLSDLLSPASTADTIATWLKGGSGDLQESRKIRDQWCELADELQDELDSRRSDDPSVGETEAEVEEELEERREVSREKIRKVERDYAAAGGTVGGPAVAAAEGVMGWIGNLREGLFRTIGLGIDQTVSERVVGLARLALAAIGIFFAYTVAARLLGGGAAIAERSAERVGSLVGELKDIPLG